jgi:predicted ATPase
MGKSVMLQRVRERAVATGARALATAGVESEAELAFAGLHQLLHPILDLSAQLPAVQRRTLEAALGLGPNLEVDRFRIAVAAFQLVCAAADSTPIVLTVDDAHWVDRSSLTVLAFIARRLENEPVALVVAVRPGQATPFDSAHLRTLELDRLSAAAAAMLLDRHALALHSVLRARVLAESAGNPLAVVELAQVMAQRSRAWQPNRWRLQLAWNAPSGAGLTTSRRPPVRPCWLRR